jgi:phosphoribosylamine--glycine ligase
MKVLVVGSGGREHALCWHLREHSPGVEVFCAPGNGGIAAVAEPVSIAVDEVQALADFAEEVEIGLTVVGPELPLALGLVDELQSRGLRAFGPTRAAAQLESSKVFAKEFMRRWRIPTPDFAVAHDAAEARAAAERFGLPVVLKADGLASGKGVLLVHDEQQLEAAVRQLFGERRFGAAADRVVVETLLTGEEVSFICLTDGERVLPMATSKDYKRIGENDTGENTGGMGAHSPSGVVDARVAATVVEHVLQTAVSGMAEEGIPFVGFLYAGIMLTDYGPKVLEFNVRLGDPEAQALLLRLTTDLVPAMMSAVRGGFEVRRLDFRQEAAACLVLAAEGYPGRPVKGARIEGIARAEQQPGARVFHSATARTGGGYVVAGGRVLNVCATGADLHQALQRAYSAAAEVSWPGYQMRPDIGRRVLGSAQLKHSGVFRIPGFSTR